MNMDAPTIRKAKIGLTIMWVFAAGSLLGPADVKIFEVGRLIFWATLGIHAIECAVFAGMLRASKKPISGEIFQVLLYGVAHYAQMKLEADGPAAQPPATS